MTGAQKTERHHVEAAFDICLDTAKLMIKEFKESNSANPNDTTWGVMTGKLELTAPVVDPTTEAEGWGQRTQIDGKIGNLGHALLGPIVLLEAFRSLICRLLALFGWC